MDLSAILAAAKTAQNNQWSSIDVNLYWQQVLTLHLREALTLIAFGLVCVFYGRTIFKILVAICAAAIGMVIGMEVGRRAGSELWGGVIGLILLAVVSLPLLKWMICALSAIAGGIITGGIWYACGLPPQFMWAGALTGAVAGGMVCFIVFDMAIMLFTCLAGTAMILTGILALFNLYQSTSKGIQDIVLGHIWFVPVALIVPTLGFIYMQNKFGKGSSGGEA